MKYALILLVLVVAGFALWVRHAPVDAARWHTDPNLAESSRMGGFALRRDGDLEPPVFKTSPQELLERLDRVARSTPRTRVVAGSVEEGRITYETRSKFWMFPDYTTVTTIPVEGGAMPVIDARLRFGKGDMGVNRKRIEDWLAQLDAGAGIAH